MNSCEREHRTVVILAMKIVGAQDVVDARQRARELAAILGFSGLDQVRIATSVSEIARNVHQYAGEGTLEFSLDLNSQPQVFWMCLGDRGPGISDLRAILTGQYESQSGMGIGITGTRRLMDYFEIESESGQRTTVRFGKRIPSGVPAINYSDVDAFCNQIAKRRTSDALDELQRQNRDLLRTLETLRIREVELETREHELSNLNLELQETNQGVVALYGELDEKAAALRRADEMKSRFLWHVSHEFRTPLNAIQALTRLLLEHTDGPLSAEQEKQVTYIRSASGELTEMVNDLLDLAKVESGKADLRMTRLDVAQLLAGVRALMRPLATNEAVRLVFEEPEKSLWMTSDESKVSQILRNLISNALKFTHSGYVSVSAQLTADGTAVAFVVKDTGIGIAAEDLERVFKEFEQVDNFAQERVKGTGLGLSLSRKLAALLNGRLEVTSSPGLGSTFTLTIPLDGFEEAVPQRTTTLDASQQSQTKAGSILLIDDDEVSRYVARQLFSGSRHRIIEAASGVEGSERARFEQPALILLDLSMPDRGGLEVLEDLKSTPETREIPVVIHSSRKLSAADCSALSNRILASLPKNRESRKEALLAIRDVLGEPDLFATEPEFSKAEQ